MSDCLFCKIVAGEIPSSKVYEDDVCYAFNDIDPQAPTHFLVVPKAHIGSVSEITADNSTVVAHIFEVIAKLTKEKGLDSYRVVSNIGEQAGQSGVSSALPCTERQRYDVASGLMRPSRGATVPLRQNDFNFLICRPLEHKRAPRAKLAALSY